MPPKGRAVTAILQPVTAALRALELKPGSVTVSAVSGGPDSVALLHALTALRSRFDFRLVAAHLNHRLRGAEADRDAATASRRALVEAIARRDHGGARALAEAQVVDDVRRLIALRIQLYDTPAIGSGAAAAGEP